MRYNKIELRNKEHALLRRLQRKVDANNSIIEDKTVSKVPSILCSESKLNVVKVDEDFAILNRNNTREHFYGRRVFR